MATIPTRSSPAPTPPSTRPSAAGGTRRRRLPRPARAADAVEARLALVDEAVVHPAVAPVVGFDAHPEALVGIGRERHVGADGEQHLEARPRALADVALVHHP